MARVTVMAKTGIGVRPENRCHAGLPGRVETKTGDRCKAPKCILTRVDGESRRYIYCIGHLTKAAGPDKMAALFGFKFGNKAGTQGRPRKPSAAEVLRQLVEQDIEEWIAPVREALYADRGVVVGNGPHAELELIPDHDVRLKAFTVAMDRVYGKPRQAMELTGANGGPITVEVPTDEERAKAVAEMLAMTGGLGTAPEPAGNGNSSNGRVNGDGPQ